MTGMPATIRLQREPIDTAAETAKALKMDPNSAEIQTIAGDVNAYYYFNWRLVPLGSDLLWPPQYRRARWK